MIDHDLASMRIALEEAQAAALAGEVPVGAVVFDPASGEVIATAANAPIGMHDPTAHAEILALRRAAERIGNYRLTGLALAVTLEPCAMCAGALVAARVGRLVFGAPDPRGGACGTLYNLCGDPRLNHEVPVTAGVRAEECAALLTSFFAAKRTPPPAAADA
jgi:tRNA(adenine34) deaminase